MKGCFISKQLIRKLPISIFILAIFISNNFAQSEFVTVLNKAHDYYKKEDYCNALDNYEKAMQIEEIPNYPMYYAAQSACQCNQPEKSFKYAIKSFANYQDFYNYEYFASDKLNKCFSDTAEWKKILGEMKPKYEANKIKQAQYQESVNNQSLRLNYLPEREKLLADSMQKLSVNKLAQHLQTFNNYQTPPKTDHWTLYSINIKDFGDIPFLMYIPKDYRPSESKSLVVYLQGAVRGRQQFSVKSNTPEFENAVLGKLTKLNTFIIYPFARKDFNWLMHKQAFETISREIQFAKTLYNINDNKVYIGGHSNGATGALWFALNNRTDFAGFYGFALSPVLNLGQSFYANLNNEQKLITLNGTKDDVFEFKDVSAVYEKVKPQKPNWILQPIKNGGHNFMSDFPGEIEQIFVDLLKENRNPFPHAITEQTDNNDSASNFWLKITQLNSSTEETKQPSTVKAQYVNNTFTITTDNVSEIKLLIPFGMVNYKKNVSVKINNVLKFNRKIKPQKEILLNHFLMFRDRKFLIANEITLKIPN